MDLSSTFKLKVLSSYTLYNIMYVLNACDVLIQNWTNYTRSEYIIIETKVFTFIKLLHALKNR